MADLDQFVKDYARQMTRGPELPPGVQSVTREVPTRAPSIISDVLVPLLNALASALVVFLFIGAMTLQADVKIKIPVILAGLALAGVWFSHLRAGWDRLLWSIEEITGADVNQDGQIGKPSVTHFELPTGPQSFRFGEIRLPPELVIEWCQAAWNRQSLAYGAWESKFALPDGTQGRERYQQFRGWLVREGYAEEVGGNIGLRIRWRNPDALALISGFAGAMPEDGTPLLEG